VYLRTELKVTLTRDLLTNICCSTGTVISSSRAYIWKISLPPPEADVIWGENMKGEYVEEENVKETRGMTKQIGS
jgi:hypothetical protein